MIDLRSDTKTKPSPEMRAAIAAAEVGDEQRREDPTVNELERRAAELLGQEEAVFVPTATMANEIALRTLGEPGDEVVAEENSHLFVSELGGPAVHAGLMTRQLRCPNGRFTPEQLRETVRAGDSTHTPAHEHRLGREHAQRLRRARLAARGDRGDRRDGARARASPPPRRSEGHERVGCLRRAGGADRRALRHGHALSLEGPRLPARRAVAGSRRADGDGAVAQAPVRRARCGRRGSSPRPGSTRSSTTSSGSRTTTPARGGSPRGCTRPACRSTSSRSRRTSSRSSWRRSGSSRARRSSGSGKQGVGLSMTAHPTKLRAVTHLDIGDEDIERAVELIPRALGALARA